MMETIQKTEILDFPPGLIQNVRKNYGLDQPGAMDEAVDILDEWIKKQNHFTEINFSREYLERTIITCKGSIERAKLRIDKMCTLRTLMPNFFEKHDVKNDLSEVIKYGQVALLPKLFDGLYRTIIIKCEDVPDSFNYKGIYKYGLCMAEYLKLHDYNDGLIAILDYRDVNVLQLLQQVNPFDLRQFMTILTEGFGMRIKNIHIISPSKLIESFISIFKQILSEKNGNKIISHRSIETLEDYVSRDILPEEYGGKIGTMRQLNYNLIESMSSKEHQEYLRKINNFRTNEAFRPSDKFNDQYIGVAGTFRTLRID